MELFDGVDLFHLMRSKELPTFGQMHQIAYNIFKAFEKLHQIGVVHNDIKCDNVMINK